jgi:hypothetical protein
VKTELSMAQRSGQAVEARAETKLRLVLSEAENEAHRLVVMHINIHEPGIVQTTRHRHVLKMNTRVCKPY